jgi:hypothetical protein
MPLPPAFGAGGGFGGGGGGGGGGAADRKTSMLSDPSKDWGMLINL